MICLRFSIKFEGYHTVIYADQGQDGAEPTMALAVLEDVHLDAADLALYDAATAPISENTYYSDLQNTTTNFDTHILGGPGSQTFYAGT